MKLVIVCGVGTTIAAAAAAAASSCKADSEAGRQGRRAEGQTADLSSTHAEGWLIEWMMWEGKNGLQVLSVLAYLLRPK
jgi:hypothetical protein